jgi:membrane-associated HD superfamily phosphohydrolase
MSLRRLRKSTDDRGIKLLRQIARSPWLVWAVIFVALNAVLLVNNTPEPIEMEVGQVAKRDVEAPRRVVNRYRTELLREEAGKAAVRDAALLPSNYEINQAVAVKAEETVGSIFSVLRGKPITPEGAAPQLRTAGAIQSYIEDQLQTQVPLDAIRAAMELDDARLAALETDGRKLASGFMLTQRIDADNREAMQETLLMQIADLDRPAADLTVLSGVVGAVVQPNLVLDPQKVGRAREQAMRAIAPIYIEQGQIIIRKGDLVEPEHVEILRDLGLYGQKMNYAMAVGIVIIVALLLVLLVYYVKQYHPESARNRRQQLLLGLTIVVVAVCALGMPP